MAEAPKSRLVHLLPLRVFVLGCGLSVAAAVLTQQWVRMATERRIDEEAANVSTTITVRMAAHEALLRGAAAFFATQQWVTRDEFRRYFREVQIVQNYPGMQGIGLSLYVPRDRLPLFEQMAQREGWTSFHVWPADDRPNYHAILYLEPSDRRNLAAIGFDMHTDAVRRKAMDRAEDTGEPAMTGPVTLVQEIEPTKQAGFLIYMPFYARGERPEDEKGRRQQLAGFAYAAFRAGDFLRDVSQPLTTHGGHVAVYDGTTIDPAALLYRDSPPGSARSGTLRRTRVVNVLDRTWLIAYSALPTPPVSPLGVGLAGLLLTIAAATLSRGIERVRARAESSEAATREREGELALLVDAVPALVCYVDRHEIIRVANRRLVDWFNLAPNLIIGRTVRDVLGEAFYADVAPRLERALTGEGVSYARWYPLASGARYLHTICVPHRADSGQIVGLYTLTSDLTAHKRAEEAARFVADCGKVLISSLDYEANCRAVVHLAVPRIADVAVLFRVEGNRLRAQAVAHVDDAIEAQLGAFLDRVSLPLDGANNIALAARTGTSIVTENLDPADLDRAAATDAQRVMLQALHLRSALHLPVTVRDRVWAVFSFGTSASSGRQLTNEHRQLAEEIATRVRLAVENTLLYHEAKNVEQELEHRVQLRTTELHDAIQELEAFSYSVSHDLRAPLRTIRSFTELTIEEAADRLNDHERNYLDRVRRASVRLERLIADLLAYTRISKSQVELRRVDLHTLVSDIQREHPEFQPPQAEVTIVATLQPVIGNEAYLTQCITNLLGNAVKFMPPGRAPRVRVWTERTGERVRLYVADNGIGIAREHLTRAFEMFERLHLSGAYEGTGVGLAIVRRAVQRMKGSVGVESTLGEGSTFWIELPAAPG